VTEFRWDKPLLLTENQSNFIFRLKTQAANPDGAPQVWIHSTHNTHSEPQGTARQSFFFYFWCLTKVIRTTEGEWCRQ